MCQTLRWKRRNAQLKSCLSSFRFTSTNYKQFTLPNLTQLQPHIEALENVFDFITRIQISSNSEELNQKQVAQLHAVDHLMRLAVRQQVFIEGGYHIDQKGFATAVKHALNQLDIITSGLNHNTPEDWVNKLSIEAKAIKNISLETRSILLQQPGHTSSNRHILMETDSYRWLERNAHHIWRIGHYLNQAQTG